MTTRLLILCLAASHWLPAQPPCVAVAGPQILGADLVRAVPALKAVPPDLPLAPTPLPGAIRLFPAAELQTLAARFAIREAVLADTCFQVATEPLSRSRITESMIDALKVPGVQIEILETSTEKVPVGRIEFRRESLGNPANPYRSQPVMWRGDIVYAGDRRFAIWARVKVLASVTRVVATENLRAGVPLKAGQVREEVVEAFPLPAERQLPLSQFEGLLPVRSITAGTEMRPADVTRPNDVNRGDLVRVEVHMGAARLALTGRAESAGRLGDLVPVRNLDSSRVFEARVEGKDSVIVQRPGMEEAQK
ncbi:MAG TPA: flagellar basal body P-ring formation chaperone FlgA [Bryobacteraceae bacterium]|jgi:flagella basal body P-ring formation protein FlgA|nr:flagellar basal body P-ring formation chaperone FlgA [Bryobacteraceae bacterium]